MVVLGAGESGVGTAILAIKKGYTVFVSDFGQVKEKYAQVLEEHKISWEQGGHTESEILKADIIMKSPGIPDKAPIIKAIKAAKISIVSEIEFAAQYTNATIVAITGSNGKTTTTTMVYNIFETAGYNVGLGGNIGKSFAWQVAENDKDYYVLEISSFQLDDTYTFKPHVAVVMNVTPDHLDRYDYKFENYVASKFRITQSQDASDYLVYCADDEVIVDYLAINNTKAKHLPFSILKPIEEGGFATNSQLTFNVKKKLSTCLLTN